ncbi:hypothetical protein C8J57DRAFT_1510758 [Mycena rebaudengoi]|nr:hypothetical protein C8J57DRAFT_1510758 [Mycena rebaudengoi]
MSDVSRRGWIPGFTRREVYSGREFPLNHVGIFVAWGWKNEANAGVQKISSLSLQAINGASGALLGSPINIDSNGLFLGSVSIDPTNMGFPGNQSVKIRATYINALPDGGVISTTPTGFIVSYTSEEFNIVNDSVDCTAINSPAKCSTGSDGVTGKITVGYGHICQKTNCTEITFPLPLSELNASLLLNMALLNFTKCVNTNTGPRVVLNDNQFGALSSFAFNAGCGALTSSTLLTHLNSGEDRVRAIFVT